jgi:7-carboxy-7-deazaguanine synthase
MTDHLPINELFETIQGEATHAGRPSVFIRLQGCPVGCPWCDTKHTWELDPENEIPADAIVLKAHSGTPTWSMMSVGLIVDLLGQYRSNHVVITGGEPCQYDLLALTTAIVTEGRTVQIETSGTFPVRCHPDTWVTVSPKMAMPGGLAVRDDAVHRANEIKMPVGKASDIIALFELLDRTRVGPKSALVWLQPLSLSKTATDLCIRNAISNGFRVSFQTHALAGVR